MPLEPTPDPPLSGHSLRNAHLRKRSLERAEEAPPLARSIVKIRAEVLGLTRLELVRRSGISRGTLRDLELGVHTPTRRILQRFLEFCEKHGVPDELLEELRRLYAGSGETLGEFIARLQLRAGSPKKLASLVGISPATLWEYQRGHFPIPLPLFRKLCKAVDVDPTPAEPLWIEAERKRLLARGYPQALAEFWVLCARKGLTEKHLARRGVRSATLRRLRYLEVPDWEEMENVAKEVCRSPSELLSLKALWNDSPSPKEDMFGRKLRSHRKKLGIGRRELADLFGIGGKKPARILKYVEEDGFFSMQAYPAGLVALLVPEESDRKRLLDLWKKRRKIFHRRHRPEFRLDLRLTREMYGFQPADMEEILGYTNLEYQRLERGVSALSDSGRQRILEAVCRAGEQRIEALVRQRESMLAERKSWKAPRTVAAMFDKLIAREGGLSPLARLLKRHKLEGFGVERLRKITQKSDTPAWCEIERIAEACDVLDLSDVRSDWNERYREHLRKKFASPLGVELRLLIAETASSLRAFSPLLGFNYSVLVRNFQRIDADQPIKWAYIERILVAANLPRDGARWREMHALWYTASDRRKRSG